MKHFFILISLFFTISSSAQMPFGMGATVKGKGKISGGVIDSLSREVIEYVTVALFIQGSDKPVDGVITDNKGVFRLQEIKNGTYTLKLSFLGYDTKFIENIVIADSIPEHMLGRVILSETPRQLDEVVITGQQSLVENKIDRMVYNATKDISNKGGTAADVLRKVPTLSVDLDGNLSMRGSQNVRVLINGKPSTVMSSSIAEAMKMIPSDEIDKVEVLTSPGAKYDAEGTAGIINIITKRKTIKGVSGNLNISAGTRSQFMGVNGNVKMDKVGFNVGLGGFRWQAKGRMDATRSITQSDLFLLTQGGENISGGLGGRINFGVDYDINEKNNINASVAFRPFNMTLSNDITSVQQLQQVEIERFRRVQNSENANKNIDATVDYKYKFKKPNHELTVSGQMSNNARPSHYTIEQYNRLGIKDYYELSDNLGKNREITGQIDYTHPLSEKLVLDLGGKSIFRRVESNYAFDTLNYLTNIGGHDAGRSSSFGYFQDVYAGYAEGTWTISDRWGLKAGVRYEKTAIEGDIFQTERNLDQHYENLLPSATLSYKWGSNGLKLAYNQRLQRPGLFYLNPYSNQSDPKNISEGNPALEAELTHNIEVGYNRYFGMSSMNFAIYRRSTDNAIESVRFTRGDTVVTSYFNQANNSNIGVNLSGNLMFGYKFMVGGNIDASYVTIENKSLGLTNEGVSYGINGFLNWTLFDNWGVQGYAGFRGPTITAQGSSTSFYFYGLGAKRDLLNKRATLSIGLDNPFTPYQKLRTEFESNGLKYAAVNEFYAFGARVSFNWMFGKMNFSNKPAKKGINNTDLKTGDDGQGAGGMR